MKKKSLYKWAFGNKRQEKKVRLYLERGCGCSYCCPENKKRPGPSKDEW